MSYIRRTPAGDLIIDLRLANPPEVADGRTFSEVAGELERVELLPRLRIWVLHDAIEQWCAGPEALERGLRAWFAAAARGPLHPSGGEAVILPTAVVKSPDLVAVMQALGLAVYLLRPGGGLPVGMVELEGDRRTAFTCPPLPSHGVPARLAPVLARFGVV